MTSSSPGEHTTVVQIPGLDVVSAATATAILEHLHAVREYDQGLSLIDLWWERHSGGAAFLRAARALQSRRGELSAALRTSTRLARVGAATADSTLALEGRLRELSGMVPFVAQEKAPLAPTSPNRVLHLVKESRPYLSNGFTSRSHYNFRAEKAAGLDPFVVTEPGFPRSVVGDAAPKERRLDDIPHYHLDVGPTDVRAMPVDRYLQLFADLVCERVRRIRPAVIHASSGRRGYETALVALAVGKAFGIPVVYEVRSLFEANWTDEVRYEESGELYRARRRLEDHCMERADLVLTIGESMRHELVGRGVPDDKIGVVPNGVDRAFFHPRPRSHELAARTGVGSAPTFGYVSNMDHFRESQETLVAACATLKEHGRDEHCVIVGDGQRRAAIEELSRSLGVSDRVHFTGSVNHDEVADYYSLIDVFVIPRTRERAATHVTPLKPFEAMAMEIPVIVSGLPALLEIAAPPHRGWAFTTDDAQSLAGVVAAVLDDPLERRRRVAAASQWIETEREWVHNGPRYRAYFDRVVNGKGGRR